MRIVRSTCLLAVLLVLAGCASSKGSARSDSSLGSPLSAGASSGSAGSSGGAGASSSGVSRQPGPAPSDSDGLRISGPIGVTLLSRSGPLEPAGPFLGTDMADLLGKYRAALGGQQPSCLPSGCWADARIPTGSVLLAVRPESTACYQLTQITSAQPAGGVRLDLQLNYVCRTGVGTAARMAGWLFALPTGALPAGGKLTVRVSARPGTSYTTLGTVTR
jgi:hypothetical protein